MPLPERRKNESMDKFVERCMSNPVVNGEYKGKQKIAVCLSQARKRKRK